MKCNKGIQDQQKAKIFYVKSSHRGTSHIWEGTLQYLSDEVFGYYLECGNSYNKRISLNSRTVRTLVSNLNKSANECRRAEDYYEVSTKEEFDKQQNLINK